MIEGLISFCVRRYGRRGSRNRALRAVTCAGHPVTPASRLAVTAGPLMGARRRFEVPEGWVVRGFRFEVEPTTPEQPGQIAQSFGGRRFAYNWALAQVKANLEARKADPEPSWVW